MVCHDAQFLVLELPGGITKNITGLKLRARGTGEFKANSLNLDASLKKATAVTGDVTPPDGGKDNTGMH